MSALEVMRKELGLFAVVSLTACSTGKAAPPPDDAGVPAPAERPVPTATGSAAASAVSEAAASSPEPSPELVRWRLRGYVDDARCAEVHSGDPIGPLGDPELPALHFSIQGYIGRILRVEREIEGVLHRHCISVTWPAADTNNDRRPVKVAANVDDGWFRGIENTLARVPWRHVEALERLVIDDRPKEHGIAPFDMKKPDDERDGRTIWLHEQLFEDPNHWMRGNYGNYWAYHVDQNGQRLDGQPADHDLFSPVLLHELGHIVNYVVINHDSADPSVPRCAKMCGDRGDRNACDDLTPAERETGCISPYCAPFALATGTENWAEQYRFYYQSAKTRTLLASSKSACVAVLAEQDKKFGEQHAAPWEAGLPDIPKFERSVWESCDNKRCKPW